MRNREMNEDSNEVKNLVLGLYDIIDFLNKQETQISNLCVELTDYTVNINTSEMSDDELIYFFDKIF